MNKGFVGIGAFLIGGAAGFAAAYKLLKDRFDQRSQDEIDAVKERFRQIQRAPEPDKRAGKPTEEERRDYVRRINQLGYTPETTPKPQNAPKVISPDEYGANMAYEEISLTYYADGTLADDSDRAMTKDEIEQTVGSESLHTFGQYEADAVFVQNDELKVYYEILTDPHSYADVLREKPYLAK